MKLDVASQVKAAGRRRSDTGPKDDDGHGEELGGVPEAGASGREPR